MRGVALCLQFQTNLEGKNRGALRPTLQEKAETLILEGDQDEDRLLEGKESQMSCRFHVQEKIKDPGRKKEIAQARRKKKKQEQGGMSSK